MTSYKFIRYIPKRVNMIIDNLVVVVFPMGLLWSYTICILFYKNNDFFHEYEYFCTQRL